MLLLLPTPVLAQDADSDLATVAEMALAFGDQRNARLTVPVSIAGAGPYPFIIDTGAERTVISRELAATLGLPKGRPVRVTAMMGVSNVGTVQISSLSVGKITSAPIEAPALEARHLGALGMLGIDTLQGQTLAIQFDTRRMTIRRSSKRDRDRVPQGEIVVRARSLFGQLVVTDARYRGQRVRVVIDTGAAVSIGNNAFRARIGTLPTSQRITLTSVTGVAFSADYTRLGRFELGGIGFGNLPVAFTEAAPFRRLGLTKQPALLLGMDALRLFTYVEIDFANREVRFSGSRPPEPAPVAATNAAPDAAAQGPLVKGP